MGQILAAPVPPVSEFRQDADPRLDAICQRAMAKGPADRFPSMADFAAALDHYLRAAADPFAGLTDSTRTAVAPGPPRPVPADAPPLFTAIAQDDRLLFRVVEQMWCDWSDADRPAELHIFRRGQHGFGMVRQGQPVDRWIDLFGDFMADLGYGPAT